MLAPDQKEGPRCSHTATENIYTAGTLEPRGYSLLLHGHAPGRRENVGGEWEGARCSGGKRRRSEDGAKDNDFELSVIVEFPTTCTRRGYLLGYLACIVKI